MIDIGGGFRKDKFHWGLSSKGIIEDPAIRQAFPEVTVPGVKTGIRSKLHWKDLRIAEMGGMAEYVSCRNYAIRVDARYGRIYHGEVIDDDYLNINENQYKMFSAESKAGRGHVYDLSGGVGYRVTSTCKRFVAIPMVGYAQYGQYLHMYDGSLRFDAIFHQPGPIVGLNSTYTTRWFGPWVGLDFSTRVERCAYMFGSFQWHMLYYRAHGRWNIREDMGPFYHKAYGYGWLATLGGKWEIWNNWSIGVMGSYRMFRTNSGHDFVRVFPLDGRPSYIRKSQFTNAEWHSFSASAIIAWRF